MAPQLPVVETARGRELPLAQQRGILRERGHPAVARHVCAGGQAQQARQRVALALRLAAFGHALQAPRELPQPAHGRRRPLGRALPLRLLAGLAQKGASVALQGIHQHLLGPAVMLPSGLGARPTPIPAGEAQQTPVGRPIAGAGEPRRVQERLGQQYAAMAMCLLHVGRQAPQAQAQRSRGQVLAAARRGKHDKPRILSDQVQAAQLLLQRPADPAVPHPHPQRSCLPAQQCQPLPVQRRDLPQGPPEQAVEGQVVVLGAQPVPEPVLGVSAGRPHPHSAQIQFPMLRRDRLQPYSHSPTITDLSGNVHSCHQPIPSQPPLTPKWPIRTCLR